MKSSFSLKYNGELLYKETDGSSVFDIDNTLRISLCETRYDEFDAKEWVLYFENPGKENSGILSEILDCNTLLSLPTDTPARSGYMPINGNRCVVGIRGMVPGGMYQENDRVSATEYELLTEYLKPKQTKSFENISGRSSDGMMPFFEVKGKDKGYIAAIGWTGSWRASFENCDDGIRIKTGLQKTSFYLKPGEKIRTSSILIMNYENTEDASNKFRTLIKKHFSHNSDNSSRRDSLLAFELWGGLESQEMLKRVKELGEHGIKFEDLWLDAGWYGNCFDCKEAFSGDWASHTGEWEINKRVHPNELIDVKKAANDIGMNMMLWIEPERIKQTVELASKHPDWFIKLSDKTNDLILYYGNEEAYNYVFNLISHYVDTLDLSCYRQDFNTEIDRFFNANDEENRIGISEITHINGMYRLWDELRKKYPHLLIDNCASGGRRIDIETLKRSIPFFRSDYQCEFNANGDVLQCHNVGISRYLPFNGCTSKSTNTYDVRSSYSSSWGGAFYNAVFQSMTEDDFTWAKERCDEYRKIRKYFSCDFYNHASRVLDSTSWAVWQYHDPETKNGIIMAFRRGESPFDTANIELSGNIAFETEYYNFDTKEIFTSDNRIKIALPQKRSSVIFEYKPKS